MRLPQLKVRLAWPWNLVWAIFLTSYYALKRFFSHCPMFTAPGTYKSFFSMLPAKIILTGTTLSIAPILAIRATIGWVNLWCFYLGSGKLPLLLALPGGVLHLSRTRLLLKEWFHR